MDTTIVCKLLVAFSTATSVLLSGSASRAQPLPLFPHHHHTIVRPVVVNPAVVRPYPVVQTVYRQPIVVYTQPLTNPLPAPILVTIVNPLSNDVTLSYTINGRPHALAAGSQQQFTLSAPRPLEFDRGGGFGINRTMLHDGVYTFVLTNSGWAVRWQP